MEFTSNAKELLALEETKIAGFASHGCAGLIHPEDGSAIGDLTSYIPAEGEKDGRELRLLGRDGQYIWCICHYQAVYNKNGEAVTLLCKLMDISGQKEREQDLIEQSERDTLTGLYNRGTVEERINQYLKEADVCGYFIMVDIDDFKQIRRCMRPSSRESMPIRLQNKKPACKRSPIEAPLTGWLHIKST